MQGDFTALARRRVSPILRIQVHASGLLPVRDVLGIGASRRPPGRERCAFPHPRGPSSRAGRCCRPGAPTVGRTAAAPSHGWSRFPNVEGRLATTGVTRAIASSAGKPSGSSQTSGCTRIVLCRERPRGPGSATVVGALAAITPSWPAPLGSSSRAARSRRRHRTPLIRGGVVGRYRMGARISVFHSAGFGSSPGSVQYTAQRPPRSSCCSSLSHCTKRSWVCPSES